MRRILALLFLVLLPLGGMAQEYPAHENTLLNDYADLLEPALEEQLKAEIRALRAETGVELSVLTIASRAEYGTSPSIEAFATGLFNSWGIGDASRNDGILILVVRDDREMRIELGAGYGPGYDSTAARIIRTDFLPAFKQGDYPGGILSGTEAVIRDIARRAAAGQAPPQARQNARGSGWLIVTGVLGALAALVVARLFGRKLRDRLRRCPKCGQRGMHSERHVLKKATRNRKGKGEEHITCLHCDFDMVLPYSIAALSSSSDSSSGGGSFGGGTSAGGGASGSW